MMPARHHRGSHRAVPRCTVSYQRALEVEGLRVLAQQHHVLLQVIQAPVLVVTDTLLRGEEAPVRPRPRSLVGR